MKVSLGRYKQSIETARKAEPHRSIGGILLQKLARKCKEKYNFLRFSIFKDSTFLGEDVMYMCSLFPVKIIDRIVDEFRPRSVLDVGCGTGVSLAYFLQNGVDGTGVENSKLAISKSLVKEKIIKHNLKRPLNLNRKFDLVWSFEVIEHIHPHFEATFLDTLVGHSNRVIISAAFPNQGGHGHFNEQLPQYWITRFSELGFQLNERITDCLQNIEEEHAKNILVFEKRDTV